jgi:acetylornithine deacetylase/succinyl-diaminopimelate desuccinylase-like protein
MGLLRIAAAATLLVPTGAYSQPQDIAAANVRGEARAMLEKMISYPTVAGKGAVPRMAEYLRQQLRGAGFVEGDIEIVPTAGSAAMIVRYRGDPVSTKRPVLFLAHMDVVDANTSEWKSDPWQVVEKDGALYGRGIVDNKFGVLTLTQAFMRLKREGFVPDRDLILAFSGDEESGMETTKVLAERLKGAEFAINSDAGGGYRTQNGAATYGYQAAEKTYATFEITARNKGGHSSRPRADNAIYDLSRALARIAEHQFPSRWNEVTVESFRAILPMLEQKPKAALERFLVKPTSAAAEAVIEADPSMASEFRTTCVATMLRAGIVENALPTEATATVNCRIFPGETVDSVREALASAGANEDLQIKAINAPLESPVSEMPDEARRALDAVLAIRAPGATVSPYLEAGGTDGLQFRRAGIATIGAGPLFSTDQSNYNFHGIDERLPITEFDGGLDHFYLFMKALAGGRRN